MCFCYCGSIVKFEIKHFAPSNIALFIQDCFGDLEFLVFPYVFLDCLPISVKNVTGILMEVALNLYITFGRIAF
jgi:hypothetical protein